MTSNLDLDCPHNYPIIDEQCLKIRGITKTKTKIEKINEMIVTNNSLQLYPFTTIWKKWEFFFY
jgi:hypothetical protein